MPKKVCVILNPGDDFNPWMDTEHQLQVTNNAKDCDEATEGMAFVYQKIPCVPDLNGFNKLEFMDIYGGNIGDLDGKNFQQLKVLILAAGARIDSFSNPEVLENIENVEMQFVDVTPSLKTALTRLPLDARINIESDEEIESITCDDGKPFKKGTIKDLNDCLSTIVETRTLTCTRSGSKYRCSAFVPGSTDEFSLVMTEKPIRVKDAGTGLGIDSFDRIAIDSEVKTYVDGDELSFIKTSGDPLSCKARRDEENRDVMSCE